MYQEAPTAHKDLAVIPRANHDNTYYGATLPLYEASVLDFLPQNVGRRDSVGAACMPDPF